MTRQRLADDLGGWRVETPYFSYRWRTVTPDDPWPAEQHHRVLLHHPLAPDLLVPYGWDNGRLQLERLNALEAAGYQRRTEGDTDFAFLQHAQRLSYDVPGHILDHPRYFRLGDSAIIIGQSYSPEESVRRHLPLLCEQMTPHWNCTITCDIGQQFNIYFPTRGIGYEIRRPSRVRGPRRIAGVRL